MILFTAIIKVNDFLLGDIDVTDQPEIDNSKKLVEIFIKGNQDTISNLISNSETLDRLRELLLKKYNIKTKYICGLHFQKADIVGAKEIKVLVYTFEQDKEE